MTSNKILNIKSKKSVYKVQNTELNKNLYDYESKIILKNINLETLYFYNSYMYFDTFILNLIGKEQYNINNFACITANQAEYYFSNDRKRLNIVNYDSTNNNTKSNLLTVSGIINTNINNISSYYHGYELNTRENKEFWETKIPVYTALKDATDQVFATSLLIENKENLMWTKLYHGYLTKNTTLTYDSDNIEILYFLNLIKNLPRNLNGFTLTINIKSVLSNLVTLPLYEFKNGNIIINLGQEPTNNLNIDIKNCNIFIQIKSANTSNKTFTKKITSSNCYILQLDNLILKRMY
jgi:hypothetical protein